MSAARTQAGRAFLANRHRLETQHQDEWTERIRAIEVETERSAGAVPIDVERLAEAILRHDANDSWPSGYQVAHDRGKCWNRHCAEAIASEYARLVSKGTDR